MWRKARARENMAENVVRVSNGMAQKNGDVCDEIYLAYVIWLVVSNGRWASNISAHLSGRSSSWELTLATSFPRNSGIDCSLLLGGISATTGQH
jgi:hypothetical protein